MAYGKVLKFKLVDPDSGEAKWFDVEAVLATEGDGTVVECQPTVGPGGGFLLLARTTGSARPEEVTAGDMGKDAVPPAQEVDGQPGGPERDATPPRRGSRRQATGAAS